MRRPLEFRLFGDHASVRATIDRLTASDELPGWNRTRFPLRPEPSSVAFTPDPEERFAVHCDVLLLLHRPREAELQVQLELHPTRPGWVDMHDIVACAFVDEVLASAAAAAGAGVSMSKPNPRISEFVPNPVASALVAFSRSKVIDDRLHPDDEARFASIITGVHRAGAELDGATLTQWLVEDVRWPQALSQRLGQELDRGLALLRHYDDARSAEASAP